ncbi:MAG: hypothetical protein IKO27_08250 [Ruminococcus sp.]|nr:hypothetical protein [Ruminococcus sp.]
MEKKLNDNVVIPADIKKMSKEERKSEIQKLEAAAAAEKGKSLKSKSKRVV